MAPPPRADGSTTESLRPLSAGTLTTLSPLTPPPIHFGTPPPDNRAKLAEIYGLEMSFVATRSGLTRTRVYELSPRIKKLAELFIKRHNRAVDEAWYSRTVDWNMRFQEDSTVISVPNNAYVRLIAKLRQRITQRHPAANNTRSNCDPLLDVADELASNETAESGQPVGASSGSGELPLPPSGLSKEEEPLLMNSRRALFLSTRQVELAGPEPVAQAADRPRLNYAALSTFELLDLLANSSVHVSATQTVIANRRSRQHSPVAVTGHLYDYATFARRFLNTTSLDIRTLQEAEPAPEAGNRLAEPPARALKVDICPNGQCPSRCGLRDDSIDCLLVDNNGFIVVGEELAHVGRSLVDYDERLMQSLIDRKLFHKVLVTDYQAICARADAADLPPSLTGGRGMSMAQAAAAASSSSSAPMGLQNPLKLELARALLSNFASALIWTASTLYSALFLRSALQPDELFSPDSLLGQLHQWQRSAISAQAQSAVANQSLLALLPNKTYLRPCERTISLYELRAADPSRMSSESPEYYRTKCGCSGWYVHEAVPKTNLMVLIVNTTSACRRCDSPGPPVPPITAPLVESSPVAPSATGSGYLQQALVPNKTAEDQVCAMLERDSQLFVLRPGSCLTSHPEEANIHICGGSPRSSQVDLALLLISSAIALLCSQPLTRHPLLKERKRNAHSK